MSSKPDFKQMASETRHTWPHLSAVALELRVEAALRRAYTDGERSMRERAIDCIPPHGVNGELSEQIADIIRALPIEAEDG
jgi:hypothetical protein